MEFLGKSQTFIGVLASLLVLCLAFDGTNIHRTLLKGTRVRVRKSLRSLGRKISTDAYLDCLNSDDYKKIKKYIQANPEDASAVELISLWESEVSATLAEYSTERIAAVDRILGYVDKMPIRVLAPLYSLLCSLFLFVADEFIVIFPHFLDEVMSVCTLFLLISIFFWTILWIRRCKALLCKCGFGKDTGCENERKVTPVMHNLWLDRFTGDKAIRPTMFCAIIVPLAIFMVFYDMALFVPMPLWLRHTLGYGMGIGLVIVVCAHDMCISGDVDKRLPYKHCVKHWCGFLLFSIAVAFWCIWMASNASEGNKLLFRYSDSNSLIVAWSLFILFNGLVIPVIVSYWGYDKASGILDRFVADGVVKVHAALNSIKRELADFVDNKNL